MEIKDRVLFTCLAVSFLLIGTLISECKADDPHWVYLGVSGTHLSNVDAGKGYNGDHEDAVDHASIDIEYQYHFSNQYLFASFGIGVSRVKTEDYEGWECGGCNYPSQIRLGYKIRID